MTRFSIDALLLDVDGTLAETEELHRLSFNRTFAEAGLPWSWSVETYRRLLATTGGRERILAWIAEVEPERAARLEGPNDPFVAALHARKTELYAEGVARGEVALCPGIPELLARARELGLALAIATTTSRANVEALFGAHPEALPRAAFATLVCGEDTKRKKPDPEVYRLALERLGLPPGRALAVEDSRNGVLAAKGAGVPVVAIPSLYTAGDDLGAADQVLASAFELLPLVGR
ncbi:MAG: HAD-IA family hydrolase [Geminicoccaceae bacterium]|nr:HAD-IA family hydrolase [Geminicoccaceae bacterium]MCX7631301.1 HAD-IA family hydrolase [Geminicoccaceae bacterium]MDW8371663.1 HAD-IA family hydrolase [Geminicoccaceae bacterium]